MKLKDFILKVLHMTTDDEQKNSIDFCKCRLRSITNYIMLITPGINNTTLINMPIGNEGTLSIECHKLINGDLYQYDIDITLRNNLSSILLDPFYTLNIMVLCKDNRIEYYIPDLKNSDTSNTNIMYVSSLGLTLLQNKRLSSLLEKIEYLIETVDIQLEDDIIIKPEQLVEFFK